MANNSSVSPNTPCVNVDIFPFFVAVFITNLICMVAVLRGKPRRASHGPRTELQTHMLVCALSISDTCNLGLQCLMPVTSFLNCGWWGGQFTCNLYGYFSAVLIMWSTWIVVIMAVQRSIAAAFPFHYRIHFTTQNVAVVLGGLLFLHCIYLTTPLFGIGEFVYYEVGQFCSLSLTPTGTEDTIFLGVIVAEGFLVVAFVLISSIYLSSKLRRRNEVVVGQSTVNRSHSSSSSFVSLTKAIAGMFCLCYLPLVIRIAVDLYKQTTTSELGLEHTITLFLLSLNSLANPIVFMIFHKRYRVTLKQLICCFCKRASSSNTVGPVIYSTTAVPSQVRRFHSRTLNSKEQVDMATVN